MTLKRVEPGGFQTSRFLFGFQVLAIVTAILVTAYIQKDFSDDRKRPLHMAITPDLIPHLVLGFNLMAADFYWLRTIQELDFKDSDHIKKGWVFQMLESTTNLSPRYEVVYVLGALVVSVIVHDDEGARLLLEKGVKNYPNNWMIAYHAAYHYLYVIKDCKRAAELFQAAAANGAPSWVNALAARLYNVSGQYDIARSVLVNALKNTESEPEYHAEIQKRLEQLEESHAAGKNTDFTRCEDFNNHLPTPITSHPQSH